MQSSKRSGPLVHLLVSLITVALAFLILVGGPEGFKRFLVLGVPWMLGVMVLVYLLRGIRKVFSEPETPFVPSARGLRLNNGSPRSSLKMGRWTVMETDTKTDEPFEPKK